jgi:hypothetical protein
MNIASTTLVSVPIVNRNTNPVAHKHVTLYVNLDLCIAAHHQILIPVDTAVIMVAYVKYAHVSAPVPTVNIWCTHMTDCSIDCCYGKQYSQISKCFLFPSSATDDM